MKHGIEEGDVCGRDGCEATIEFQKSEDCSCHIWAPCDSCTSVKLHCPECDWGAEEEPFNDHILTVNPVSRVIESYRLRELDATKIDWHSFSHSSCSMIKEGVYPQSGDTPEAKAADIAAVRKVVDGTFGGRFEHIGNGRFKFIAYTD